jgi:hypothetical protein
MSKDGEMVALGDVGGSLIWTKDVSRWDAYDSRASASSATCQRIVILMAGSTYSALARIARGGSC